MAWALDSKGLWINTSVHLTLWLNAYCDPGTVLYFYMGAPIQSLKNDYPYFTDAQTEVHLRCSKVKQLAQGLRPTNDSIRPESRSEPAAFFYTLCYLLEDSKYESPICYKPYFSEPRSSLMVWLFKEGHPGTSGMYSHLVKQTSRSGSWSSLLSALTSDVAPRGSAQLLYWLKVLEGQDT